MPTRNQVLSLFGASPEQIRAQQAQQQAQLVQQVRDPYQQTGMAIGTMLGRALGGKSPEVMQAEQMQQALQGVDINDPAQLRQLANTVKEFAPERALQILDRATQVEGQARDAQIDALTIDLRTTQGKAAKFELEAAEEDRPAIKEARELATSIKRLQLQEAQGKITDRKEAKEKADKVRQDSVTFLRRAGLEDIATLVEDEILGVETGIKSWIDSQDTSLDLVERGAYTTPDGQEVIAAFDKKTNKLVAYDGDQWVAVEDATGWTKGKAKDATGATIKQGRTLTKDLIKTYDKFFDEAVDVGWFSDSAKETEVQTATGISDITSATGKRELYRRAEQIYANNPGITEGEALQRAIAGERVTAQTTQQQPAPQGDEPKPDLGATKTN
jgi:hypothetical protein